MLKALSRPNHSQVSCDMHFGWLLPVHEHNFHDDYVYAFFVKVTSVLSVISLIFFIKAKFYVAAGLSRSWVHGFELFSVGASGFVKVFSHGNPPHGK